MEHLHDQVSADLWQLDEDHLQEVCRYLKCDVSSGKPRQLLIRTVESMLDKIQEKESESDVIQHFKDLLAFMSEVRFGTTDVEVCTGIDIPEEKCIAQWLLFLNSGDLVVILIYTVSLILVSKSFQMFLLKFLRRNKKRHK